SPFTKETKMYEYMLRFLAFALTLLAFFVLARPWLGPISTLLNT
ncbi:hypothetical protein QIK37_gp1, partial [ssRNA phage SRR6050738_3]